MRLKALGLAAIALIVVLASTTAQSLAIGLPATVEANLKNRARAMINVAAKAELRVRALVEKIEGNETIIQAIENAGLNESYNEMLSLIEHGSAILRDAEGSFDAENYADAIQKAIEAMGIFKDAFVGIHKILCNAGVTPLLETPELKAQGILVAANRSLERIMRVESLLNASEVMDLLEKAKGLLNEIKPLLERGNVTAAAHNLSEANKLIAEALARLRHRAEEMIQRRAEKFILNFGRVRSEIAKRIREEGLNETEVLEILELGNFTQIMQDLISMIRETKSKNIKGIIDDLRKIGDIIRGVRESFPKESPIRVKIEEILENTSTFEGKIVMVSGSYCGQKPPESLLGPSGEPPGDDWWIIADGTGWIYVVGGERVIMPTRRLPIVEGAKVTVIGKVMVKDGTPYIREWLSVPSKPVVMPIPPVTQITPSDALRLSVEVQENGKGYLVKVTIKNAGNEAIIFQNAAYGIVIQRWTVRFWLTVYTPISAQVLTRLEPGESRTITIPLERPLKRSIPGTYRVVAMGWFEESRLPITAAAEFVLQ